MSAQVTEIGRPEQGVAERVGRDVGVGVSHQSRSVRNLDQTEPERTRGVVTDAMHVDAVTDPHRRNSIDAARARPPGTVIFTLSTSPATTTTRPPCASTSAASSVASPPWACARTNTSRLKAWGVWTVT